jgi:HTH-type transcriptional regulator/antitoxin HigA
MKKILKIITEADHKQALKKIDDLWNAEPGTEDYQELDQLADLVVEYEKKTFNLED